MQSIQNHIQRREQNVIKLIQTIRFTGKYDVCSNDLHWTEVSDFWCALLQNRVVAVQNVCKTKLQLFSSLP
jgi:hypothetical protein